MPLETEQHSALERRVTRSEDHIGAMASAINKQGENVASLTTAVEAQSKQIGTLFGHTNKPFPVNNILALIGLLIMLIGLALAPLYRGFDDLKEMAEKNDDHRMSDAYNQGKTDADLTWLKELQERNYAQAYKNATEDPYFITK